MTRGAVLGTRILSASSLVLAHILGEYQTRKELVATRTVRRTAGGPLILYEYVGITHARTHTKTRHKGAHTAGIRDTGIGRKPAQTEPEPVSEQWRRN